MVGIPANLRADSSTQSASNSSLRVIEMRGDALSGKDDTRGDSGDDNHKHW